jgi:hypothetical protein
MDCHIHAYLKDKCAVEITIHSTKPPVKWYVSFTTNYRQCNDQGKQCDDAKLIQQNNQYR